MTGKKLHTIIVIFILAFCCRINAQNTGNIYGRVTDSETGAYMIGAVVQIKSSLTGSNIDLTGRYTLKNVMTGTYDVTC